MIPFFFAIRYKLNSYLSWFLISACLTNRLNKVVFILCCLLYLALYCINVVNCILNIFRVSRQFSPGIHSSKLFHFPSPSQIPQYFERKQARQWKILFCQSENRNGNQSLKVWVGEIYLQLQFHVWEITIPNSSFEDICFQGANILMHFFYVCKGLGKVGTIRQHYWKIYFLTAQEFWPQDIISLFLLVWKPGVRSLDSIVTLNIWWLLDFTDAIWMSWHIIMINGKNWSNRLSVKIDKPLIF